MSMSPTLTLFLSLAAATFIFMTLRRFFAKKQAVAPAGGRLKRWGERLKSREWRRYGFLLAIGKLAGLAPVAGIIFYFNPGLFGHKVFAADAVLKGNDIVNPINTVWTLVAAFLVFGMQAGFTMLEAGFCRSRETVNVLIECIVDTCLCGILFYAWASPSCSATATDSSADHWFFLQGTPAHLRDHGRRVPRALDLPVRLRRHLLDHHLGRHDRPHRLRRRPALLRRRLRLHLSDHRPLGLGSGRLPGHHGQRRHSSCPNLGTSFHDFAGSTVVHTIGGFDRPGRRHRAWPAPRPQVQARRRRPHDAARSDHRRIRRPAPLVRLVRLQPRQHALGDGLRRHRPHRRQHHPGGLRRRPRPPCSCLLHE